MKFQIMTYGWPMGAVLIPAGQIIDLESKTDTCSMLVRKHLDAGGSLPRNVSALDQESWDARKLYCKGWVDWEPVPGLNVNP
jgi:hypothetical protein